MTQTNKKIKVCHDILSHVLDKSRMAEWSAQRTTASRLHRVCWRVKEDIVLKMV